MNESTLDRADDDRLREVGIAVIEAKLRTGYEGLTVNALIEDLGGRIAETRRAGQPTASAGACAWDASVLGEFTAELWEYSADLINLAWQWANHSAHSDVDGLLEGGAS